MATGSLLEMGPGSLPRVMLGICLCFKDCAAYLEEWLLFHYVQGFRRFYLYNNDSEDHWLEVAKPWIHRGLVWPVNFPGRGQQQAIYDHCLWHARGEVDWLAFIDDDEFLFPVRSEKLSSVLAEFSAFAGVAVSWVVSGSCGHEFGSPGWVLERFTATSGIADQHVKCIVQPERISRSMVIGHMFHPSPNFQIVDENKVPVEGPLNSHASASRLRINHYMIKSWEEWRRRRARPRASTGTVTNVTEADWRTGDEFWSSVPDGTGRRFGPAMHVVRHWIVGQQRFENRPVRLSAVSR